MSGSKGKDRCAFCRARLSEKRVAFDPAKTRLWAICKRCGQWNLSPLDFADRRAVVEELEMTFASAGTARGVAEGIAVAELGDRRSVVRVGEAPWAQFASWRYGKKLRWRRFWWFAVPAATPHLLPDSFLSTWESLGIGALVFVLVVIFTFRYREICRVRLQDGSSVGLNEYDARRVRVVVRNGDCELLIPAAQGESAVRGREAMRVLAILLAHRNHAGATREELASAVAMIERAGGPERVFETWLRPGVVGVKHGRVMRLSKPLSLTLEIAAQEDMERRALQGELAVLRLEANEAADRARIVEQLA